MIISVLRMIFIYVFIVVALRIMGKRQISDMQTSELVITLIIADIAAIPVEDNAISLLTGLIPILVLMAFEITVSIIMMKSSKFRSAVCGKPVIIIENGRLLQSAMKKLRISTEDLFAQLRMLDVFHLEDISYCIAETNGQLSVLLKAKKQPLTSGDANINPDDSGIEAVVVNDGVLLESSMKLCHVSREDILSRAEKSKLSLNDIFIMTATSKGEYKIIRKEKS